MVVVALGSRADPVRVGGAWWWTSLSRIWSTMPEMAAGVGELLLDVDEVVGEAVEPGGGDAQDRERGARVLR